MRHRNTEIPSALAVLLMVLCAFVARAQDEVRLTDGGVLQGKIIKETETNVELKHPTFGVIQIPRERIVKMGPYGTLGSSGAAPGGGTDEDAEGAPRGPSQRDGTARSGSRLDPDYQPPVFERPEIPQELREIEAAARLEAEMDANPELAALYQRLLHRDVLADEDAQKLFVLNERAEADPDSLTALEKMIVEVLLGDAGADEKVKDTEPQEAMPPAELAGVVESIRGKLSAIKEAGYREIYVVAMPEGKIEIRYDRQLRAPNLAAGRGQVVDHVEATQRGREIRYFSDGESMWLLTRRGEGSGKAYVAESAGGSELTGEERSERARAFEAPRGVRLDETAWDEAGLPAADLSRARLLADPFAPLDLATLRLEREDEKVWVFTARMDSAAFSPLETAELTIARETGLVQEMKLEGGGAEARMTIEDPSVDSGLPSDTFLVPEAPAGQGFELILPPASAAEALTLLGAL